MAPEINQSKRYKGSEVDIFAIVHGTFPFMEATKKDKFYNMLLTGDFDAYFDKIKGSNEISDDFKDLFLGFVSYRGEFRPTV